MNSSDRRLSYVGSQYFIKKFQKAGFRKVVQRLLGIPRNLIFGKIRRWMKRYYGINPVPYRVLSALHYSGQFAGISSPLQPLTKEIDLNSENIVDPKIRMALRDQVLSLWSVDVESINWIVSYIKKNKIKHVLEFGSGLSTVALTIACRDNAASQNLSPYVVSIDQNAEYVAKTRQLLADLQLDHLAEVIHCPLVDRTLDGHVYKAYKWDIKNMAYLESGWRADMIFVDGPTTGDLSRALAAIDGLECATPRCAVLMDDALRHDEIISMLYLNESGYVSFKGVIPTGKGIALSVKC